EAHVLIVGPDVDDQNRIRLADGTSRQKCNDDVAFAIDAASDTAHYRQLELLGAAEVILRKWYDSHAGRLDDRALRFADHGLHQLLAGAGLAAKDVLRQKQVADVKQVVEVPLGR